MAVQAIKLDAFTNREMPVSMCPSIISKTEFINGTPGVWYRTHDAKAISGVFPK